MSAEQYDWMRQEKRVSTEQYDWTRRLEKRASMEQYDWTALEEGSMIGGGWKRGCQLSSMIGRGWSRGCQQQNDWTRLE